MEGVKGVVLVHQLEDVGHTHGKAIVSEGGPLFVLLVHLVLGVHDVLYIVHSLWAHVNKQKTTSGEESVNIRRWCHGKGSLLLRYGVCVNFRSC